MNYTNLIFCFILGIGSVTMIDTVGALLSRQLRFNYAWLSILSFAVYTGMSYCVCREYPLKVAMYASGMLGLYDATVGLWLSRLCKANIPAITDEQVKEMGSFFIAFVTVALCLVFALIGYWLSRQ